MNILLREVCRTKTAIVVTRKGAQDSIPSLEEIEK